MKRFGAAWWMMAVCAGVVLGMAGARSARGGEEALKPVRPELYVPFAAEAPAVDGVIDEKEWDKAAKLTGFMSYKQKALVPAGVQPDWYVMWDEEFIYFAQRYRFFPKGTIVAANKQSDLGGANPDAGNKMVFEDHLEIQLATQMKRTSVLDDHFYKFIVNPYNAVADQRIRINVGWWGLEWESGAAVESKVTDEEWTVELALPWDAIDVETPVADGQKLYAQLVSASDSEMFYVAWVPSAWTIWKDFGTLVFDRSAPAVRVGSVEKLLAGEVDIDLDIANPADAKQSLTATARLVGGEGEELYAESKTAEVAPGGTSTVHFAKSDLELAKAESWMRVGKANHLELAVKDGEGTRVFRNVYRFVPSPADLESAWLKPWAGRRSAAGAPTIRTAYMPSYDKVEIEVDLEILGLDEKFDEADHIYASVERLTRKHYAAASQGLVYAESTRKIESGKRHLQWMMDVEPLPAELSYGVHVEIRDAKRKVLASQTDPFRNYSFPWEGNQIGKWDDPIPPFTDVVVDRSGKSLTVLNREIAFAPTGLPVSIKTGGHEILSEPVSLTATVNGKKETLAPAGEALEWTEKRPGRAVCVGTGTLGPVKVRVTATTDYDGQTLFALAFDPGEGAEIGDMRLTLPMPETMAQVFYTKEMSANSNVYGAVGKEDGVFWHSYMLNPSAVIKGRFLPYLYIGDGEFGLTYSAASDRGWIVDYAEASSELRRAGETIVFELRLANTTRQIDKPRELEFALQAVPVKPLLPEHRSPWGHNRAGNLKPYHEKAGTRKYRRAGGFGFFMGVGVNDKITFYDELEWRVIRDMVLSSKRAYYPDYQKVSVMYTPTNTINRSMKEVWKYGGEWSNNTYPDPGTVNYKAKYQAPLGPYNTPQLCKRQFAAMTDSQVDMRVWAFDQLQKKAGLNGFWWDHSPFYTTGKLIHGDAYITDAGEKQSVLNIFRMRRLYKRMAVASYLNAMRNAQGSYAPPTMPFGTYLTYLWAVEGMWYLKDEENDYFTQIGLDRFRAMCGRWSGISPRIGPKVLDNDMEYQFQSRSVAAMCLLHDVNVRGRTIAYKTMKHMNAMLADFGYFGNMEIEWVPYWRSETHVEVDGGGRRVVATAYPWHACPRGPKAMVAVVNAGDADTEAHVALKGEALLGEGKTVATVIDAETGEEIAAGDALDLTVRRHDFRLLIVK